MSKVEIFLKGSVGLGVSGLVEAQFSRRLLVGLLSIQVVHL